MTKKKSIEEKKKIAEKFTPALVPPILKDSNNVLSQICEILGIQNLPVKRLWVEIDSDNKVSIYTDQFIEEEIFDKMFKVILSSKKTLNKQEEQPPLEFPSSQNRS